MMPLARSWLVEYRPKSYCTFSGSRSMLQHTLDRARTLFESDCLMTVIQGGERPYWERAVPRPMGTVIEQPGHRGTAAAILVLLTMVLMRDADGTVLLLPSDHFVYPEKRFNCYANEALRVAEKNPDAVVMLGAEPNYPEPEYGWIEPAPAARPGGRLVSHGINALCEKPDREQAERLYAGNWLWNTRVIAAKARTLWTSAQALMPDMTERFEMVGRVAEAVREERVPEEHLTLALEHAYAYMPSADFFTDVLAQVIEQGRVKPLVLPMMGVQWSDWGRPERIVNTLSLLRPTWFGGGNSAGWKAGGGDSREIIYGACLSFH